MKKLNMYELIDVFSSAVCGGFNMKLNSRDLNEQINKLKQDHFFTDSGNNRYPDYFKSAVTGAIEASRKMLFNQRLIFCYEIDGVLYTTFNSDRPNEYNFKGDTQIPNYRKAGKEDRLIELRKNNGDIKSGYYYSCGKPFFISVKRG